MLRVCGADISGSDLVLVTVNQDGATLSQDKAASTKLSLSDSNDQAEVRAFFSALQSFVRDHSIAHILVRGRVSRGQFAGGATGFKIEGYLQLIDRCEVRILAPASIAAKRRKSSLKLTPTYRYQSDACDAALCGLEE
ncbi:MAG: DUF3010 family protein [Hyphomonadaceae bacterium]|nr:DUF3010 family protein [Hyphomonadaceae bacterium]